MWASNGPQICVVVVIVIIPLPSPSPSPFIFPFPSQPWVALSDPTLFKN